MIDTFVFLCLSSWSPAGVFGAVQSVSVTEGDTVTLNVTDVQMNDKIEWQFGSILIAEINIKNNKIIFNNGAAGGRFRDRLELDQTGSLTITDTRNTHSGLYTVTSSNRNTLNNTFHLSVYAHLPVPVITRDFSQCSSSSSSSDQNCSLLCSAVNVSHVTLSWFRGISVLSSISASDLSSSLSLSLELDYQDNNSYSCVLNNPIRNQTTHLNITQLCRTCPEPLHCCGFTEAVIRLAVSALVGVAAVAVLVYDIRSGCLQQKKRGKTSTSNTD